MKYAKLAVIACLIAAFSAPVALRAQKRQLDLDFKLINRTGLIIAELYVSPASSDKWGKDILGKDVLANGESADITFSASADECNWDMKIVDEDDDSVEWESLN